MNRTNQITHNTSPKKNRVISKKKLTEYLSGYINIEADSSNCNAAARTKIQHFNMDHITIPKFINEFWTSKQRKALSIHEISYRACFKPQLPRFFIELLTKPGDIVYDPFSGRGTTVIEAALLKRNIIANDINPLSEIMSRPRLTIPDLKDLANRLDGIKVNYKYKADIDLSMFYHEKTEAEIVSLKKYLSKRKKQKSEDAIDSWIRMVATNRLTGHSKNFFSVYTLPPNQAVNGKNQIKINQKRNQKPIYKNVKDIILKKSSDLLKGISQQSINSLYRISNKAVFLSMDARETNKIKNNTVDLTVTSPPFLNVVQYDNDNWLRCWFNEIDVQTVSKKISMARKLEEWCDIMQAVFCELFRITKPGGWVAFEVGEVKNGKVKLDEHVVPLGIKAGFNCICILINQQRFTKTSNIWGVKNNSKGTNSNRIVIFNKA